MQEERYNYAQSLYDREFAIKERLEAKAAVVFSLPSTLIAAVFLEPKPASALASFLADMSAKNRLAFTTLLVLFVLFLVCLLGAIAEAVASILVQQYRKEYPKNLYLFLSKPGQRHLNDANSLYEELAGRLAIATEHNAQVNEAKSRHLGRAVVALGGAVISLFLFLTVFLMRGVLL